MLCPLCSGPVHQENGDFVCQVGHRVTAGHMADATELHLAEAMWMAIQALDNEADVLRALGGEKGASFANEAESQAHLLREFARTHAPSVNDPGTEGE